MNRREFLKKGLEGIVIASSIPLISGCKKNPAESEPDSILNINSIIKDNIEYYMQTDKKDYKLGENVEMLYRVTNLGNKEVYFGFPTNKHYHFRVKKGVNKIWEMSTAAEDVATYFRLQHDSFKEFNEIWNLVDEYGIPVGPGDYQVIGELYTPPSNYYVPVPVPIKTIQ